MAENTITQIERDLLRILNDEYSFYQSLYILLDKQRDLIKYDADENLLDLFSEIERCHLRIRESESKISALKDRHPQAFKVAAVHPEIKKLVNCIVTLVKKNLVLVGDNEQYIRERHERIRQELETLQNSGKVFSYLQGPDTVSRFVDGKR
jgi:hypothetical protein